MKSGWVIGLIVAGLALTGARAGAAEIGSVAAVNPEMTGTPPDDQTRELILGNTVVRDERIETSRLGSGQLMFLDQTALMVAPNSNIVLDRYVYDPDQDAGDLAASVTKGALRFIGGRITKQKDGVVHTPTATIGIRGALVLILVGPNGVVEIIHIAGEYTSVRQYGDKDGDGLDDGPPEGETVGPPAPGTTLSRPNARAEAGPDGIEFTGLVDSGELAEIFGVFVVDGQGGVTQVPSDAVLGPGLGSVAALNSEVRGGDTRQPVSTSGEQAVPGANDGPPPGVTESQTEATTGDTTDPTDPGQVAPPPAALPPQGGAASMPGSFFAGFDVVVLGSLTGTSAQGEEVRIPAAQTPADFQATILGAPPPAFLAQTTSPNSGFFDFALGDGSASVLTLGNPVAPQNGVELPIRGAGFSDLDNNFHFAEYTLSAQPGNDEIGYVVFGDPTPAQAERMSLDDGTVAASANTVDVWVREPALLLDEPTLGVPDQLFLLANGGALRFEQGLATSRCIDLFGTCSGAAWFGADLDIADTPNGQESTLEVLVRPVLFNDQGGPRLAASAGSGRQARTTRYANGVFTRFFTSFGTLEDADGNTVFGADADYLVIGTTHRNADNDVGLLNTFNTTSALEFDVGGGFSTPPPFGSLFTRDPALSEIVADPLPLADDTQFRQAGLDSFRGFATAMVFCSTGHCGAEPAGGGFGGFYDVKTIGDSIGFVQMGFGDGDSGGIPVADFNESFAFFRLTDGNESGIVTNQNDPLAAPDEFVFQSAGGNAANVYLDDSRFLGASSTSNVFGGSNASLAFRFASSGLVGDGGVIPPGVDSSPDFVRWGWWSAEFLPTDAVTGRTRTDVAHLGNMVFGGDPDTANLPTNVVASYTGFAVGTEANFNTQLSRVIGGSFALTYDFGQASGVFDLDLASAGFAAVLPVAVDPRAGIDYSGQQAFGPEGQGLVAVDGNFYSGGGDVVAATGGQFDVIDPDANRQIIGVFGGDRQ